MTVECTVTGHAGNLTAVLTGRLTVAAARVVRLRLLSCLAEQPSVLIVDLGGLRIEEGAALGVLRGIVTQARRWPGTMVLLSGRQDVHPTMELARAHARLHRRAVPSVCDQVVPADGAALRGRTVATGACVRWALPALAGPACLIITELVSNVIDHVSTPGTLRIAMWPGRVSIGVRDGSPVPPRPRTPDASTIHGRGLLLVETVAAEWGWLPTHDGKVVWATLDR